MFILKPIFRKCGHSAARIPAYFLVAMAVFCLALPALSEAQETQPGAVTDAERAALPEPGSVIDARDMLGLYVINPLDLVLIVVYGGDRQVGEYQKYVNSDGTVYLPFLEQDVQIGGMRLLDAEARLEDLAQSVIRDPRIVLTVVSSYTQTVSTYGKIASSTVELKAPMRILQLLARVGGPQQGAREDSVRVISMDGDIRYFNYREVNTNPDDDANFYLKAGDIVYVPGEDDFSVMVTGDVTDPGSYYLSNGDTLLDALLRAGSWDQNADLKNIRILRVTGGERAEVKKIDLSAIFNKGEIRRNYALADGDIIFVPTRKTPAFLQTATTVLTLLYTAITSYAVYLATK